MAKTDVKSKKGKLAYFPIAEQVVEITEVNGRVATFAMFTKHGLRISRTYLDFLELLEWE